MSLQYALVGDMDWQQQAVWQTPDTPFMTFDFWQALIDTGAIGAPAGWLPIFIMIYRADPSPTVATTDSIQPVAVMPVFVKGHHRGEYVFDHTWAEAYARYGIDYYPRLVTSVPYTPITGERFWLAAGECINAEIIKTAMAGIDNLAQQVDASSWHGLFVTSEFAALAASTADDIAQMISASHPDNYGTTTKQSPQETADTSDANPLSIAQSIPILERQGCQFLWQNKNMLENGQAFTDFEAFLATLKAKKRKTIRAERRKVAEQGISCVRKCGDEISDDDWSAFYHCYVMTYAVRGQQPYLTAEFFRTLAEKMPQHLMLAQAYDSEGEIIASSLFLYDVPTKDKKSLPSTLYGRYWGALGEYDSLHFELCYYQGIEFAIEQGLSSFDPGTQGEHKLIRGFVPTATYSLHRIYDARFVPAISDFCLQDRLHMARYREQAHAALPFNADNMPDFDSAL